MGITQCTASGTNTILLTPTSNQPTVSSLLNFPLFGFVAAATTTGAVNINVNSIGALPLYLPDGATQADAGAILVGSYVIVVYNAALNSAAGGFQIISQQFIGQYQESVVPIGGAVSLSNVTPADVTSFALTAGTWNVWGAVTLNPGVTTTISQIIGWISTTSATLPTLPNGGAEAYLTHTFTTGQPQQIPLGMKRIKVTGSTPVYMSVQVQFGVSTMSAYGILAAERIS